MIKDIIVNLGLGSRDPAGEYAISVAEAFGAHVLGIAVSYEPIIPGTVMGGIPSEIIESQRVESDKKARTAVDRFEQAVKRAGISAETRTISASISGALPLRKTDNFLAGLQYAHDLAGQLLQRVALFRLVVVHVVNATHAGNDVA